MRDMNSAGSAKQVEKKVARAEALNAKQLAKEEAAEAKRAKREAKQQVQASAKGPDKHRRWSNLSYTTRVTISFALVAAMTALVAFGVLSFVWEQHFQTYTRENMQRIATNTATSIGQKYAQSNDWYKGALSPAASASDMSQGVGVQVSDSLGNIIYDDSRTTNGSSEMSLAPTNKESMASATIYANGESIGTVRVWVYGSNTLLTQTDQEFREKSYQAMVLASILAVILALCIGFLFARGLVNPINRISKAAKAIGEGDLSARTNLHGDDEIARLGQTFDDMAESVQKDRQLERRLTTDVAHELRTPLMAIQSTVEAMVDGVFAADEERLDTVNSEVQRLSRLVDAILKLARLENRSTPMNEQVVNVGDLITGLIATHEAFVKDSGLELFFDADKDVYVYGDPDMIRQATANLISNAVRYTPEGHITVSVKKGDLMASIAVADTGIGLTAEEAKMVFSRFWRADAGRNRESGGLGIGLAVVKEIVDRHGGWVRVEGKPNEGATFTIFIPLYDEERIRSQKAKAQRRKTAHNDKAEKASFATRKIKEVRASKPEETGKRAENKVGTGVETKVQAPTGEKAKKTRGRVHNKPAEERTNVEMMHMDLKPDAQGKVRDLYDLGDKLLLVATDRISAFDYVLPDEIPYKGKVLTQISIYWLELLSDIVDNHLISAEVRDLPEKFAPYAEYLDGRFMLVKKAEMFPVECIVRGYLTGSGLKSYEESGTVCGIALPGGLVNSSKLPKPIFTPSTKAELGDHDENIDFARCAQLIGEESATAIRDLALKVYEEAAEYALNRGIIIADTKFEFGTIDGKIVLADEVLTPDSSRFWAVETYAEGEEQPSFDKQQFRNWLNDNWDRTGTPPHLPKEIVQATSERYIQAYERITGQTFAR